MRTPSEHLRTIQRRVDFLKSRDHKNSFDHAELGSLEWALVNLQTERKPLTDEQLHDLLPTVQLKDEKPVPMLWLTRKDAYEFARAIEAAHGIKENT